MQETFEKLQKLQEVLSEKYSIEQRLEELPKQLIIKNEILERIISGRNEKEAAKKLLTTKLSNFRISLLQVQSEKEALEEKMGAIKTQREFEVLEKEINDTGLSEEQFRKDSQKAQNELNELQRELDLDNQLINEQEIELADDKKQIEEESTGERQRLNSLILEEKIINPGMGSDLLSKFETIIRNKSGLGIVSIRGGICQGCHMVLPGQFVNQVRSGEQINFCPHCSRILFFEEGGDDFSSVFFDHDDMGALSDLIDDDDYEEEEEPPLIDSDMAGDYEDN